ncbi:MAG TPA: heparan-alpha-glucosaminide N-acetyltransferase domain-containing protein [Gammaproteobacteria bacterium]
MPARQRIAAVDILRGLAMVLMALDHVRHYFAPTPLEPEDLADPGLGLFFTRWITHFCAPVFVFLAGTSAWLYRDCNGAGNGAGDAELRRFLLSRGTWLVVAEFLLFNPLIPFWLDDMLFAQVIWAIGWSMVALGILLPLGYRVILSLGLLIVFGHNLLDGIDATRLGVAAPLWQFLHEGGAAPLAGGWKFYMAYPVLPWIGVMLLGYAGGKFLTDGSDWRKVARVCGGTAIALFVVLRLTNLHGNPVEFTAGATFANTLMNFINVEKYPPSLLFVLMTLGPALLLLPALESLNGRLAQWLGVFGRVPFFYYLLHFILIFASASAWSFARHGESFWWFKGPAAFPPDYEFSLLTIYVVWALLVVALYPACRWYADFKRRHRNLRWLSYV